MTKQGHRLQIKSCWRIADLNLGVGAGATLLVLAAVTLTEAVLPQRQDADLKIRYRRDRPVTQKAFREMLAGHGLRPQSVTQHVEAEVLEYSATVEGFGAKAEALRAALRRDPTVLGFACQPHKA
ncbi:MAG: hypothetical protein ACK41C_02290 [Phenylobacterium sp.]|uniref:hypothetical protein n=1 Tax=Phenylobacterium sp. TaxID=1871053 RepID=UPI003919A1F5